MQAAIIFACGYKIVELLPVNFYTMSEMGKGTAIADLAAYLKIAPSDLQINVLTQKFDLNSYLDFPGVFY